MASTTLARSVGYPGSSIAFAQLLSGMERSGLIVRDVRGKRTYRVGLTDAGRSRANGGQARAGSRGDAIRHPVVARRYAKTASAPGSGEPSRRGRPAEPEVDYDELARRLLVQVARRLAGDGAVGFGVDVARASGGAEASTGVVAGPATLAVTGQEGHEVDALAERLAVLEAEIARARAARLRLQEENEALRDQIERIRQNLETSRQAPIRTQVPLAGDLIDHHDLALLQQMLMDREDSGRRRGDEADSA